MVPEEWGWLRVQNRQHDRPATSTRGSAEGCHAGPSCRNDCDTPRCSCKKHCLECSVACGECKGVSCMNSPILPTDDVDDTH